VQQCTQLDAKYAKGCDVYVTEQQPELVEISSGVQGVPPFLARYTIDTLHTPGYAAGYLANEVQPRLFMTTHMPFDPYLNEEAVAEVREHWNGPFHFGAPDGIVVNVTKEQIGVREGILPDYPSSRAPQFDFTNGQLVVPHPRQVVRRYRSRLYANNRLIRASTTQKATILSCWKIGR
jgi:ribonuclease Z